MKKIIVIEDDKVLREALTANYYHCRCRLYYDILYHSDKIIGCSLR